MKIYLFLQDKILTFIIPQKISGSFSFDEYKEEEAKLINIEARDNEWVLYSTDDSKIISSDGIIAETSLKINHYYVIKRNDIKYLIYVMPIFDDSFLTYTYDKNINLTIGNDNNCSIVFENELIKGINSKLTFKDNSLILEVFGLCYKNGYILKSGQNILKIGDEINIYGLRIVILNGLIIINNPMSKVKILSTSNLQFYTLNNGEDPKDLEVKDIDLYNKDDYYSKSPRLRRIIKTKKISISPPPKQEGEGKMPLLLTIGPMITMGIVSGVMVINNVGRVLNGTTTLSQVWPQLISSGAMLISMILWPSLTRSFNKKLRKRQKAEIIKKYTKYLDSKREELETEEKLQRDILTENLLSVEQCINIINNGRINFWDKRIDQSDFLDVRVGIGNALLDMEVSWPEEGFTLEEDELKEQAEVLIGEFKYIKDVPIKYSLYENKITALMGEKNKDYGILHNIILQLITFYSYEDLKIVVFTNEKNEEEFEYIKYLPHNFSNDKSIRFFSTNSQSAKYLCDYLNFEIQNRGMQENIEFKPHYIIITDDFAKIKRHIFTKTLTEVDNNLGFSMLILENQLSKLPSKCNNFISLGSSTSGILKNSYEEQERIEFRDEINTSIDMMSIAKKLSNIPIEFEEGSSVMPDSISFLEMERVGKVEQLNILNRWDINDSTTSLKAEIGVDEENNLMYLDLHEKYHGPHGLIAGMTGSGKSEFIITYILSMAINYSPDDVAFILIDYKGGGLAFAFENKATGVSLPHLAGTITNLDKAEMDRTLVSIDSEIKRRQKLFNEARDILGESTIDIYKYQRYFKEGRLKEAIPHLFIICDEFAELKVQQPDFMDNLISVARIGRSLGVHLILATQKPSGVVNDQIWSNTKFRVCLKVQDASDSKEVLKRPDAASLKQTGRFYLQVGYDEYFALGQSAWCGAKYYPSEKIVKQVDKSVNFIDDIGNYIKSIQAGKGIKIEAKGEQLANIMANIIEVSKITGKKAKRLWLNNIDPIILIDNLEQKYSLEVHPFELNAVIGEYDAPEKQEQGVLLYSINNDGNTAIFGNDEKEREKLLQAILYSLVKNHTSEEINIYAIDYGSESLRTFNHFPQIGGTVFMGEDERFKSLFKLINEEIKERKKLFVDFGGSLENYNKQHQEKMPYILFIVNNYEGILESYNAIYEDLSSIGRECERYGIIMILTCDSQATLGRRMNQCFGNKYALHLIDTSDYYGIFGAKSKSKPRDILGRGLANNDGIHEFQTASIVDEEENLLAFLEQAANKVRTNNSKEAPKIPSLPDKVTFDLIQNEITSLDKVPIGISRDTLKTVKYDFKAFAATSISSNRLENINSFMDSLLDVLVRIKGLTTFFIDTMSLLPSASEKQFESNKISYFNSNLEMVVDQLIKVEKNPNNSNYQILYIFYGIDRLKTKVDPKKIEELFASIKVTENSNTILCDSTKNFKNIELDLWYSKIKNNTDGIWIGKGYTDQTTFRISKITKEMSINYPNNYGYCQKEGIPELIKLLEFNDLLNGDDDDE